MGGFASVSFRVRCLQIYGEDNFAGKGFLQALKERLSVNIISETEESIEFDLVGIEAPLANALRRILLAEVYTCFGWMCEDTAASNGAFRRFQQWQ